jgi:hypothetical protein
MTERVETLSAGAYLAGANTRRLPGGAFFGGRVGKNSVSRAQVRVLMEGAATDRHGHWPRRD